MRIAPRSAAQPKRICIGVQDRLFSRPGTSQLWKPDQGEGDQQAKEEYDALTQTRFAHNERRDEIPEGYHDRDQFANRNRHWRVDAEPPSSVAGPAATTST